jgi:hypothetical protein
MIRDRSLLALLSGEFVSRLGATSSFIVAVAALRGGRVAQEAT